MPPTYGVQVLNQVLEIQTLIGTTWEPSGFGWAGQPTTGSDQVHYICFGRHPEVTLPAEGQAPAKTRWRAIEVRTWVSWKTKINGWLAANPGSNYLYFRGCVRSKPVAEADTWSTVANAPACSFGATAAEPTAAADPNVAGLAPQIFTGYVNVSYSNVRKATIISLASPGPHPRTSIEVWTTFDDATFPTAGPYEMAHAPHWPFGVAFDAAMANTAVEDTWEQIGAHAGTARRHTVLLTSFAMNTKPF